MRRTGLQAEVLASLAVVMILATLVLGAVLVRTLVTHYAAREAELREHLARALVIVARDPRRGAALLGIDANVWTVAPDGSVRTRSLQAREIDRESLALAAEARETGTTLLTVGPPADPIRLATPVDAAGAVAVVRLPRGVASDGDIATAGVVLGVLLANAAVFTLLGVVLLRRRVISPLRRLSAAARAVAEGGLDARVPVEGTREMADVASAFNDMTEALGKRTDALEKAVAELRETNRDLRRARAGLDRAERLASVGSLAAGVAHEVGNPTGALLAFLDLVGREGGLSEQSRRHLAQAREQSARVGTIVRQLLDFSRPPRATPEALDLAALAEQTAALIRAQPRYDGTKIEVVREPPAKLVRGDRGLVVQILLNLVLNAADAVRGSETPRIELRVRPALLEIREGDSSPAAAAGRRSDAVECRIADSGPGIAKELRERVFDPFFTTKPPGEGTGLGLANALRLAEQLDGQLELLDSAEGEGAVFALRLPVAHDDAAARAVRSAGA